VEDIIYVYKIYIPYLFNNINHYTNITLDITKILSRI